MQLSYFLLHFPILKPLIKDPPTICDSTEDLLSGVDYCNTSTDLNGYIIRSMDVEALYPSIDISFACENCEELLNDSDLEFANVDY